MKVAITLVALFCAVNCVPFDPDVIIVDKPEQRQNGRFPEEQTPFGGFGRPGGFSLDFNDSPIWNRFSEIMKNFHQKMSSIFNNTQLIASNLPPNYHNSTSETKNVNGTIITVNQTIDTHKDNNSQSVFHIKIVQVRPQRPSNETKTTEDIPTVNPEVVPEGNPEVVPEGNPDVVPEGNPEENVTGEGREKTPDEKVDDKPEKPAVPSNEP